MTEKLDVSTEQKYVSQIQKVFDFTYETAELRGLGPVTTDGLRKFAFSRFGITKLEGALGSRKRISFEVSDNPKARRHRMKPDEVPQHLQAAKNTAFNIWCEYLSGNPEAESAANEVIIFINNLAEERKSKEALTNQAKS